MMEMTRVAIDQASKLTEAELDHVALQLVQLERTTGWTRILGIGQIVLERFFAGDRARWSSRKRNKSESVRRLAERPGCPLQKTALTEAVGVYILHGDLPTLSQSEHLTPSHAAAVLGLSHAEQRDLLSVAEGQRLSVSDLRSRASACRAQGAGKLGRPPLPGYRKAVTRLTTAVVALEEAQELVQASPDLDEATRSSLLDNLRSCARLIATLEHQCGSQRTSLAGARGAEERSDVFAA